MIKKSQVAAVVNISQVVPAGPGGGCSVDGYAFRADAKLERGIKGKLPELFIFYSKGKG